MRTVFDALEGILGKDQIAKIKADSGLTNRLAKSDELFSLYDDENDDTAGTRTPTTREDDATTSRTTQPTDLAALTKSLSEINTKLGDVPTKKELDETIERRGQDLAKQIGGDLLRKSNELNQIHRRHEKEFKEEFDGTAFETWADEQIKAGKSFTSITDAYEHMTAEKRYDARLKNDVREELKKKAAESGAQMLPGVTPPSSKSPLSNFMRRGKTEDGAGSTSVDKAANALRERMAARSSEA